MFIEALTAIVLGICVGIFSGLTPGIHINLISLLVVSFSPLLLNYFSPLSLGIFIIAMAITHTFLDTLPGIYLGAPDSSEVLNVLPGHRMLLKGEGHKAVILTIIGSLFCLLLCLICFPFLIRAMGILEPIIRDYIGYGLIIIMAYMILKEKKPRKIINALLMFLMAGVFGLTVLSIPNINQPLFPLLSGLFGFSLLIISLKENTKIPEQDLTKDVEIKKSVLAKSTFAGSFVAALAGFLPGFGSSQAAIIGQQIVGDIGDKGFLVLVGGINTANMLTSIGTAYILNKARNGAIISINKISGGIDFSSMVIFLIAALVAAGAAVILSLKISKVFSRLIVKVNYAALIISILLFITVLTFYFDGILGLSILLIATAIGMLATELGVGKNHLMGCLILPVICFFMV